MQIDWKQVAIRCALLAVGIVCLTVLAVKAVVPGSAVVGAVTTAGAYLFGLVQQTPMVPPKPSNDNGGAP